jgi:hypothetical protein
MVNEKNPQAAVRKTVVKLCLNAQCKKLMTILFGAIPQQWHEFVVY